LSPSTGQADGYSFPAIADKLPNAWGNAPATYRFAVNPVKPLLVATGNFQTVGGASRTRLVMFNLGANGATVDDWYYQPFSKPCSSTHPRRIAYLQGVDWSPDGDFFSVAATGQIPAKSSDVWHWWNNPEQQSQTTVCDGVGRFAVGVNANDSRPEWINYTGGDSVWRVQDTNAAVYATGHFQWLDNPDGFASRPAVCTQWSGAPTTSTCLAGFGDKTKDEPAKRRLGIGAINPSTGKALDWAPQAPSTQGGKGLLATESGLWVGSDSKKFGGKPRWGLAFAPLA
jgi:hypothetical protein